MKKTSPAAKAPVKTAAKRKAVQPAAAGALGVLPDRELKEIIASGAIMADGGVKADQIQTASLDLRLGKVAYRLRASFLPGKEIVATWP